MNKKKETDFLQELFNIIQNKAKQKLFYVDNNIPTAGFQRFAYLSEIEDMDPSPIISDDEYFGGGEVVCVLERIAGV